jgi:hypothetical protein
MTKEGPVLAAAAAAGGDEEQHQIPEPLKPLMQGAWLVSAGLLSLLLSLQPLALVHACSPVC